MLDNNLDHYCPRPTDYFPCPTARDKGCRVYGLVYPFFNFHSMILYIVGRISFSALIILELNTYSALYFNRLVIIVRL